MSIWKPRPTGWGRLRTRETGGACLTHKMPLYQVYDPADINSDAHAIFNDRGEPPLGVLCPICSLVPPELAEPAP